MSEFVCTMPECQTTAGCFCRRVGIVSDYVAPFVPSVADAYYNGVIAQKDARIEQLERELAAMKQTFEFVVRQAWREDPPHANHKLTDTERLSAIKFYPRIKAAAQPHSETRQEQR